MPNDPSEGTPSGEDDLAIHPVIPPLTQSRSPYPTRSRSRRRQLEHQRMLDDQLTADPLGLVARSTSGGSSVATGSVSMGTTTAASSALDTPEGAVPTTTNITRRRRPHRQAPPSEARPSSLFSTPGATSARSTAHTTNTNTSLPQSANSQLSSSSVASTASDYMIGKGLVQARISPMNAPSSGGNTTTTNNNNSMSSSAKNNNNTARRRRFFPPSRPSPGEGSGEQRSSNAPEQPSTAAAAATANDPKKNPSSEGFQENNSASSNNNSNSNKPSNHEPKSTTEKDVILHGMNITKLRKLTLSCLGMGTMSGMTTQSPKMAVFFAGMVHSKTKAPKDAYLYARALFENNQPKRTVKWIEQSNLLRCYYYSENCDSFGEGENNETNANTTTQSKKKKANRVFEKLEELKALQVESLLLAAQALSELGDWTAVLQLLEDTQHCTFPENHNDHYQQQQQQQTEMHSNNNNNTNARDHEDTENSFHPNHMTIMTTAAANSNNFMPPPPPLIPLHLDDDDGIAWQQLAESLRPSKLSANSATTTPDRIHPLSRICQLRARAYSELGHPLRANLYWNRALQIDPWCVLALEGLLETSVQSPASVVETVLMAISSREGNEEAAGMKDTESENDDAEWLRALYLARVCTAAPNTANVPTGGVGTVGTESKEGGVTDAAANDDPMEDEVDENDDGNGDENMTGTVGISSSFALTPHLPTRGGHPRASGRNDAENIERDDRNDPSFWQDASSIQLLTPIPQQQSVADMSAAGASLFFPPSAGSGHANGRSDHGTEVANDSDRSNTAAAAVAVGSALDTLWNKFQLRNSPEVLAMAAQNAYRRYDWNAALQYCEELAEVDPLSSNTNKAAFCHVSTLVQLNRKRPLFRLAHEWVETSPKEARSWFAVAAYYYACERYHIAQRHFCRATRLDPHCVEAWIAFGASFAACDESDQALASFRAAQRLAPGNHTSLLYIGMEYLRTNHLVLAQHFLTAANESSGGTDPLVMSETGVLKLNQRKYAKATFWFLLGLGASKELAYSMSKVLGSPAPSTANSYHSSPGDLPPKYLAALSFLVESIQDPYWEPTLFNLAHAYRKERRFDAALICLEQCLALKESASAHSALGYCLHLQSIVLSTGRRNQKSKADRHRSNRLLHKAIDSYHQSLSKKPDDPFASEMLQKALSDALEQTDFFLSDDDDVLVNNDRHESGILASPQGSQRADHVAATTPRPPRGSLGSLSASATRMGLAAADQSSLWTEDGLSVSAESVNDDVDMT